MYFSQRTYPAMNYLFPHELQIDTVEFVHSIVQPGSGFGNTHQSNVNLSTEYIPIDHQLKTSLTTPLFVCTPASTTEEEPALD
jgi:hypothetical protein